MMRAAIVAGLLLVTTALAGAEPDRSAITPADRDVHRKAGMTCRDCHGADSGLEPIARESIPSLCGGCHGDAAYMRAHRPEARLDQEALYWTSRHGVALRQGDPHAATCVDCHATHEILPATDPESTLHPTRLATTCGTCHGVGGRGTGSQAARGDPAPPGPHERWSASVHYDALIRKGDLSAPTCNDCHGNHADAPEGLASADLACGSCHLREAQLVAASPMGAGFVKHRGYMEEASTDGCADCHEALEPASRLAPDALRNACVACHGSHSVIAPTIAMFAPSAEMACSLCHAASAQAAGGDWPGLRQSRHRVERLAADLSAEGRTRGLEGAALYDWLLERARVLPQHNSRVTGPSDVSFDSLLDRLRVGRVQREVATASGVVREPIVQCTTCHVAETTADGMPTHWADALDMRNELEDLTRRSAEAYALLVAARRGRVETPAGVHEIEETLRARAELGVLLHTFRRDAGSPFAKGVAAGIARADAARSAGAVALAESRHRRLWLLVSLVMIGCAIAAVGRKVRETSRAVAEENREDG